MLLRKKHTTDQYVIVNILFSFSYPYSLTFLEKNLKITNAVVNENSFT